MLEEKGFLKKVSRETGKTGKLTEKLDKTWVGNEKGENTKDLPQGFESWEINRGKGNKSLSNKR